MVPSFPSFCLMNNFRTSRTELQEILYKYMRRRTTKPVYFTES
jgi:hypothetical protein